MTTTTVEKCIYEQCASGNQLAQMKVYDMYSKAMYNVALRILKDTAAAEDAMQESMITAFQKIEQWNREATFGAWLKRIVINNSLTKLRQGKKLETISYDTYEMQLEEQIEEPTTWNTEHLNKQKMYGALAQLNDNYREILNLYYIEGMDHEEISQIMGISYGMCRTTLSRAKASLKKQLSNG